jgi:4'-phosphopantetheinyl transferase
MMDRQTKADQQIKEGADGTMDCGPLHLDSETLHVWTAPLDTEQDVYERLTACLTPDERERARRFRFDQDGRRFSIARAVLRHTLGAYLLRAPQQIRLSYGPHGKPCLGPEEATAIHFNLTHSDALGLIALTKGRAVGIDLERIRPDLVNDRLATVALSPAELVHFRRLPPDKRAHAFFSIWTRKEAYLKARGIGLSRPLDKIEVSSAADFEAFDGVGRDGPRRLDGWGIWALASAAGYAAAVAVGLDKARRGEPLRTEGRDAPLGGMRCPIERPASNGIAYLQVFHL